ncbi:MAG: type I 3-dehydroquinate dehydratase [Syntrophales bacterium]
MICIPVAAATQAEALQIIKRSAGLADALELRMDLLADGNLRELLGAARSAGKAQVLVTNRPCPDFPERGEDKRIEVLMEAVLLQADFVDVELSTAAVLREKLIACVDKHGERTRLIVSHHDFVKTPSRKILFGIFRDCVEAGAQVVKIVTWARRVEDNLKVLDLIPYARRRNLPIIALCMGEKGRMSRIAAPVLGSLFTFAALERGIESAPGQLTAGETRQIWRLLEGN